jgi:hypothetical protein
LIAAHSPTETARRNFFTARFPDFWATVERFLYALLATQPVTAERLRSLHAAAERLYAIFLRVMPVLQALPSARLADMGIPERAHEIVRLTDACASPTVFARFDFALTADGPKMLEVNAETPFPLWESHAIAGGRRASLRLRGSQPVCGIDSMRRARGCDARGLARRSRRGHRAKHVA